MLLDSRRQWNDASLLSVSQKILSKTIKKSETVISNAARNLLLLKVLRMHKISPSGRDDSAFLLRWNFDSGYTGLVRYPGNLRQNDQKNQELSFRAQREIFCFDGVTNAEDFSLRSK